MRHQENNFMNDDMLPTPTYRPHETVEDGYEFICSCGNRHGRMFFGRRIVDVKQCDDCRGNHKPVHPKNFNKANEIAFLNKKPDTAYQERRTVDVTVINGRRIFRNVDHLL